MDWCLRLNASKTKEIVVDLSRYPHKVVPVNIQESEIEIVTSYKHIYF